MNHADILICSAVGLLGAGLYAKGRKPLLRLQRAVICLRAAGYLAERMASKAWETRREWRECRQRAEMEL